MSRTMKGILATLLLTAGVASADINIRTAARPNNEFGFNLFKTVTKRTEKGNKFLSPVSAYLALSVLYNGAEGKSAEELATVLAATRLSRNSLNDLNHWLMQQLGANRDVTLRLANSLWAREGFRLKREFEEVASRAYSASVRSLDFASPTASIAINDWVKEKTAGKIDGIVPASLPAEAVLFIINATYFEAEWQAKFKSGETALRSFTVNPGTRAARTVQVPFMHQERGRYKTLTVGGAQVIELPYKNNSTSMVIVLPPPGTTPDGYAAGLSARSWESLTASLDQTEARTVSLSLPKLKLKYEDTLNETLKTLGMPSLFSAATAELHGISDDPRNLFVSNVKQKTFLEVDEEGTKAAAVTSIEIHAESAVISTPFLVNRPYFFALRDKATNAVLFLGTIQEPEGGALPPPRR